MRKIQSADFSVITRNCSSCNCLLLIITAKKIHSQMLDRDICSLAAEVKKFPYEVQTSFSFLSNTVVF